MTDLLRQPIFRHLWRASGLFSLWALYLAVVAATTLLISLVVNIELSTWGLWSQVVPPWYMLGLGIYATTVYLPLYIAHGHTRRAFLSQALVWVMLLAPAGAALMTVTFVIERFAYRALGWTQAFEDDVEGLFTTPDQYGWIFLAFWLTFLTYTTIGAALGAAFYRQSWHGVAGVLLIPAALVLAVPGGLATGRPFGELANLLDIGITAPVTVTACLLAFAMAGAIAWSFVRDLPLRSKAP